MDLFDFFILRTPLLPLNQTFENPLAIFRENKLVQEAILISSKDLYERIQCVLSGQVTGESEIAKIENSLVKYLKRLSNRSTPFGLNAGLSLGKFGGKADLRIKSAEHYKRYLRADMSLLGEIYKKLLTVERITRCLWYFSNNTLYKVMGHYRYFEYQYTPKRTYCLTGVESNEALDLIIKASKDGSSLPDLKLLLQNQGYEDDQIQEYLTELINGKILLSELEPSVSGDFYGDKILDFLRKHRDLGDDVTEYLISLLEEIKSPGAAGIFTGKRFFNFFNGLKENDLNPEDIIQVDLYKPTENCVLEKATFNNLREAFHLCYGINVGRDTLHCKEFSRFKAEFEKRYEGMEVPLTVALDPDIGIGYPANSGVDIEEELIDGLDKRGSEGMDYQYWPSFDPILKKFEDCLSGNSIELELTEDDYKTFAIPEPLADGIMSSVVSLFKVEDKLHVYQTASESSGISVAGRFSYMDEFYEHFKSVCQKEQAHHKTQNVSVAEVVFFPEDRSANIVHKPELRDFEIEIVTKSRLPDQNTMDIRDLFISMSGGNIVIRSEKNRCLVIPRFSCVYDHTKTKIPAYNFLCDVRHQYTNRSFNWLWGTLNRMPFLPRVRYKNVILSKAKWLLRWEEFKDCPDNKSVLGILKKRKVPDLIGVALDDNVLPLSLNNERDLATLIESIKRYKTITVNEDLMDSLNATPVVTGQGEYYASEILLFWDNLAKQKMGPIRQFNFESQKVFLPGDEWIFFKIYCGEKVADYIIKDYLADALLDLKDGGSILSWFFIRYADPDFHLRLRIKTSEGKNDFVRSKVQAILSFLHKSNLVWRVQEDMYSRELHRYGDLNIANAESFFYADSECIASIIKAYDEKTLSQVRWKVGLASIVTLTEDFRLSSDQKRELLSLGKNLFFGEMQFDRRAKDILDTNYRTNRYEIEQICQLKSPDLTVAYECLGRRSLFMREVVDKIYFLEARKQLEISIQDLLLSFIHMSINRLFIRRHRIHETMCYDFLNRYYESAKARQSKSAIINTKLSIPEL